MGEREKILKINTTAAVPYIQTEDLDIAVAVRLPDTIIDGRTRHKTKTSGIAHQVKDQNLPPKVGGGVDMSI